MQGSGLVLAGTRACTRNESNIGLLRLVLPIWGLDQVLGWIINPRHNLAPYRRHICPAIVMEISSRVTNSKRRYSSLR
ncbi:hypothetical protein LshimejAT787_0704790 [Lyophyllum shimeji]|uniref:Uncharacterized protein n=1 Tax=Lyophyllum shimeji TaxID=47721 RepID=A0A9P3UM28_LYOSH|nr:hypothetical protein LshimejAT787_0704790 [Lyophyllum shimeji]